MSASDLEHLTINTIRTLAMDAVQAAKSGHPGTPMAMAPVVYCLWQEFLRFDPDDPIWPNRDRFVLSMGHASMLLYSMLALAGVKAVNAKYERLGQPALTLDDIKRFRQLDSKAPGHPEYRWTSGVEATTGPLGQGVATSVGMAIAGRWMARHFNRPGFDLFGYDVYALCGDGCMMEGISGEAASLAGHLQLANLCWIYDNNKITIEGHTDWAFSEDVATRFIAYRWNVTRVGDANDLDMLRRAFRTFHATTDRPTLIIVDSHIAYGAPNKQDTSAAHGEPLGEEEIRLTKRTYDWPEDARFLVPDGVREHVASGVGKRGRALRDAWFVAVEEYRRAYPELADQVYRMQHRQLPEGWDRDLPRFPADPKGLAGRADPPAGRAARLAARDPGSHHVAPGRRERGARGLARDPPAAACPRCPRGVAAAAPDARPQPLRVGRGGRARGVRARGRRGGPPGRAAARHRKRGGLVRPGARATQRLGRALPRRQHAVVGAVRAAAPVVSGRRNSARRHGPGVGGAGERVRLGPLRRARGRAHRHGDVRRVGAAAGAAKEVRLHRGARGRGRPSAARAQRRGLACLVTCRSRTAGCSWRSAATI